MPARALVFVSAALLALLAGVPAARLARRWGLVSAPNPERAGPGGIPLLGGPAVLAGLAGGLGVAALLGGSDLRHPAYWLLPVGLAVGFGVIGGIDDRRGLDPVLRLLLETLVASIVLRLGCVMTGGACPLGGLSVLVGALVVTAAANAFNLADNADGLAAGVGTITLVGLAFWPTPGDPAALWFAAAGATGGLWLFNRPPARIYLGDFGSLAVGGMIGYGLWQRWLAPPPGRSLLTTMLALALLLGYTLFDPAYAVLRRLLAHRAPWVGGVDHPSHDLAARLPSWNWGLAGVLLAQGISVAVGTAIGSAGAPIAVAFAAMLVWAGLFAIAHVGARSRTRAGIQSPPGG
jgi:UDP-GlcNAc:undecaprenyl-phosphate GlcNAc-1-phosphate transferase